jgi:phytoene dehydrogenase-like protein
MEQYDVIVAGSGASGLTAALLLAMNGQRVLVLERARRPGGSLLRFRRQGVPFDTGFHFSGSLEKGGLFDDMLQVLGMGDLLKPVFLHPERAHQFFFEREGRSFQLPTGVPALRDALIQHFPGERRAVESYFERMARICQNTVFDLRQISISLDSLDDDCVTLQEVLDGLTGDPMLKALFSGFCMCYGTRPNEVSFANHCRMTAGLCQSVGRFDGGGGALAAAFLRRLADLGVEVRTNTALVGCLDVKDRVAGRFLLSNGEEVAAKSGVLTIHPKDVLGILPPDQQTKAFVNRVNAFESSAGFFSIFGTVQDPDPDFGSTIISLFPYADVNRLLEPGLQGDSALVIVRSKETALNGTPKQVLTAFEPSFPESVAAWSATRMGSRSPEYYAYKERQTARIRERIVTHCPDYRNSLDVLDSASLLTFREYLNSPDGSAYGIKQKIGQFNLVGKLPVFNLYAAGQSAVLPGVVGAMMSSFLVCRAVLGKEKFNPFMEQRLCR